MKEEPDAKLDKAIEALVDKTTSGLTNSEDALRYAQAALNLARVKQILSSGE